MKTLDQNALENLLATACTNVVVCNTLRCWVLDHPCLCLLQVGCGGIAKCDGPLIVHLTEGLTACGGEFYDRCPGFDDIAREWPEFDPAVEAARFKQRAQLDRIEKLEARIRELELRKQG